MSAITSSRSPILVRAVEEGNQQCFTFSDFLDYPFQVTVTRNIKGSDRQVYISCPAFTTPKHYEASRIAHVLATAQQIASDFDYWWRLSINSGNPIVFHV